MAAAQSEAEAMHELAKQLWERYIKPRAAEELLGHSLDGYKATVITNNGDGTLTVKRPFDEISMTLRCPPALAQKAEAGDQVLMVTLGEMSNSFILCATDMEGFGSGDAGEKISLLDFSDIEDLATFLVETESGVSETYTVTRDANGRIVTIEDEDGFDTFVEWPQFALTPASQISYDNTGSGASATNVQAAIDQLYTRVGSVTLSSTWTGSGSTYYQTVTVTGATVSANSKVNLQPTAAQVSSMISDQVKGLLVENNNGTLTVWAIGSAPSSAMTIQCTVEATL